MANVSFMAHGIKLWVEYYIDSSDIEVLTAITLDKDETDIEPLVGSDVVEWAYQAIQQDIWDTREYKKECVQEMRRYDDQQGWV